MDYEHFINIFKNFNVSGNVTDISPCGSGRVNKTFKVCVLDKEHKSEYILQRINTKAFLNPEGLMKNIELVTDFAKSNSSDETVKVLNIIKTKQGKNFMSNREGAFRVYDFVPNSITYDSCSGNPNLFFECGKIFGSFQNMLRDFDSSQLVETIPNFHNTLKRYEALQEAIRQAPADRLKDAQPIIRFFQHFGSQDGRNLNNVILNRVESGELPLRVTHNDTKINNVAFDKTTGKALAVLDLDTVMPGPVCYDFGDAIRFGCNSHNEESTDFANIRFNFDLFKEFTTGYMQEASKFLTRPEVDSLVDGAFVMTYELGIRFLTDFLNEDKYFGANYYDNNLYRAINQLSLLTDMCKYEQEMHEVVESQYQACVAQEQ